MCTRWNAATHTIYTYIYACMCIHQSDCAANAEKFAEIYEICLFLCVWVCVCVCLHAGRWRIGKWKMKQATTLQHFREHTNTRTHRRAVVSTPLCLCLLLAGLIFVGLAVVVVVVPCHYCCAPAIFTTAKSTGNINSVLSI